MNDLETRLRDGLHGDVTAPDVDRVLPGVRRGAAWRRGRRASAGVAVLVALVIGGSVALQEGRDRRGAPEPVTHGPSPTRTATGEELPKGAEVGTIDVSVTGSDVFKLTTNQGCVACSAVWRLTGIGNAWTHLFDFEGAPAYGGHVDKTFGPVEYFTMAANGTDGWAWGHRLWSTHDGAHSWTIVADGPGARTNRGHWVYAGPHLVWSVWTSNGGRQELWRSPVGYDAWQRVATPHIGDVIGVLPDDRVVMHETGEGASGSVIVLRDAHTWTRALQPFTSDLTFRVAGHAVLAPHAEGHTAFVSKWEPGPAGSAATVTWTTLVSLPLRNGSGVFPVDATRMIVGDHPPRYFDASGLHPAHLPARIQILDLSAAGDTAWLVTFGNHLYSSDDGGRDWVKVE
jgi:hypothetical protein